MQSVSEKRHRLRPTAVDCQKADIIEAARRRLQESPYQFLRTVQCGLKDDVLTVTGQVPSFYLKQLIQVALENVDGVRQIENQVDVVNPAGLSSTHEP